MDKSIGVVIIGRNEGERLKRCFESVLKASDDILKTSKNIIYVDSGSSDNSVSLAKKMKITVVKLDMSIPFSAARGRNAGFDYLMKLNPKINYVQFIDGDCQLIDGWLKEAIKFLNSQKSYAIVCGRLREQYPDKSIYNRLCDIEWNRPVGDIDSCGGIFMIRARAYKEVGGMNPIIIAGEESDLCIRLRMKNWKIFSLDHDMAWHDAAMTKFSQWWKRSKRTGYAYALGASIYNKIQAYQNIKERRSALLWGLIIPLMILLFSFFIDFRFLVLFTLYLLLILRLYIRLHKQDWSHFNSILYAFNCYLIKFPQVLGIIKFQMHRLLNRDNRIIEYK